MATGGSGTISNAGRVVARIRTWPGVTVVRADCGVGTALCAGATQIMHLHCADEAEVRLTRPVVDRLGATLADSGRALIRPGGDWVAVRLDTDSDMAMVVSLASVAIKAATGARPANGTRVTPCAAAAPRHVPPPRPEPGRAPLRERGERPGERRAGDPPPGPAGRPAEPPAGPAEPAGEGADAARDAERPGDREAVPGRASG